MKTHGPDPSAHWRWPWATLGALTASIPAFYDSLSPEPTFWANGLYLLAAALLLVSLRANAVSAAPTAWQGGPGADKALALTLVVCAVLPASHVSTLALGWRLVVALAILLRMVVLCQPLLSRDGLARLLAIAVGLLVMSGVGFYWIDPAVGSWGDGLWLAFTTAATVGYGDVVPTTTASRIFAVFVVLLGYGVLSLVTAAIAAMFVGSQERKVEQEILHDVHSQLGMVRHEMAELRKEIAAGRALAPPAPAVSSDAPHDKTQGNQRGT